MIHSQTQLSLLVVSMKRLKLNLSVKNTFNKIKKVSFKWQTNKQLLHPKARIPILPLSMLLPNLPTVERC